MTKQYDMKWMIESNHKLAHRHKVCQILKENGIREWKDLILMPKKDILGIKGIGPKMAEVLYNMARFEESQNPQKYFKSKGI